MLSEFGARLALFRPRTLARTSKSVEDLPAEMRELRRAAKTLVADGGRQSDALGTLLTRLDTLATEVRHLGETVNALVAREAQLRTVLRTDASQPERGRVAFRRSR